MRCVRAVLLLVLGSGAATAQELTLPAEGLPRGWKADAPVAADPARREQIARALGTSLSALTNQRLSIGDATPMLNVLACPDEKTATALHAKLSALRGRAFAARSGSSVVEFAYASPILAKKLRDLLGLTPPGERTWEVRMELGCVDEIDPPRANDAWILFLQGGDEPRLQALASTWKLGTAVRLWTDTRPWFRADYTFTPAPSSKEASGGVTAFGFPSPPRRCGIPYVDVRAVIRVRNAYRPAGDPPQGNLRGSTRHWPTEKLRELAATLTAAARSPEDRLEAILAYVSGGIRDGGPATASRWGVEKVLAQKQGRCWDKSDVFVTLCRAAGLPARQIAGWLAPSREGHVWSEVYLDGKGWLPVDPTTPWTGTSDDYVPWFSTSDGDMPFLYLSMPWLHARD